MLLAVARVPAEVDAAARGAAATGLTLAEVRTRLAGMLPRVLVSDTDEARVTAAAEALAAAGFLAFCIPPPDVPGDDARVLVRRLALGPDTFTAFDGADRPHPCPASTIELIQRGVRATVEVEESTAKTKQFSAARAALSGGLMISKTVKTTTVQRSETREAFLVVQRVGGAPDLLLCERRLRYQFLGTGMQPSSLANLSATLARLRALAPAAPFDERVARPGFVSGQPTGGRDPVDLALHLVRLARARGA